jgi:hypothetical protein
VPELKALTGVDEPVADWVMAQDGAQEFVDAVVQLMGPVTAGYLAEGSSLRDDRDRLHRRQTPLRGDDPGDRGTTHDGAGGDLRRPP